MSKKSAGFGILATIGAFAASALAHAQGNPGPAADRPETFTVNYRESDVRAVIEQFATITRTNVVVADEVQGKITFLGGEKPMTVDEYRTAMLAQLTASGYQLTERDGILFVGPRKP